MNTIKVKKYSDVIEELVANEILYPGHLVEQISTGKVQKHATAGGTALAAFALEDELQGKTIHEAYAAADQVQVWIPTRGDMVYARLANGETAVIGSKLESAGGGELRVHVPVAADSNDAITVVPQCIVGIATEAVDMSGSSGADPEGFIIIRII